jgi:hypothetical protein
MRFFHSIGIDLVVASRRLLRGAGGSSSSFEFNLLASGIVVRIKALSLPSFDACF